MLYFVSLCISEAIWADFSVLLPFCLMRTTGWQNQPKSPQKYTRTQNAAQVYFISKDEFFEFLLFPYKPYKSLSYATLPEALIFNKRSLNEFGMSVAWIRENLTQTSQTRIYNKQTSKIRWKPTRATSPRWSFHSKKNTYIISHVNEKQTRL